MGTIPDKFNYLKETKALLKELINKYGGNITDTTPFRDYVTELGKILENYPDVEKAIKEAIDDALKKSY